MALDKMNRIIRERTARAGGENQVDTMRIKIPTMPTLQQVQDRDKTAMELALRRREVNPKGNGLS